MRISFVSDIHGNIEALARVAAQAEQLVVLGDLLDYVDYHDHGNGILGQVFGADRVRPFARLRSSGDFLGLRDYNRSLWATVSDPVSVLSEVVAVRYQQVLEAVGPDTLLTLGNVDVAAVWNEIAGDRLPYLDGAVVSVGGLDLGFVAGGSTRTGIPVRAPDPVWQPLVRPGDEYLATVRDLGPVDVLCSHVPPQIPSLRYDVVPARMEMFGPGLREYIDEHHPRWALFGHVHQPLARRLRVGRTECVNVGHFQRFPVPFVLEV
ncbi:metallophosphoesterase [Nakamurella sp. YIM 132087]|uniref:Metallophosphoesterase n=1 Tax=Nakamurella alba TaxID=2665158 RepID=A0A7K1FT82_9ACTN|nr:metallophosphoesterase [Nakamurella alba]MTD17366.1 metallophosphoesterase [Nakamurella alba]